MKTIFSNGLMPSRSPWMGSAAEGLELMNESDRDALIEQLKPRLAQAQEITKLVQWSYVNDPYLKKFFGNDQGTFWLVWTSIIQFQPAVEGVYRRLNEQDPEFWTATSNDEQDALDAWIPGIDSVNQLYMAHLASLPLGQRPRAPVPAAAAPMPILPKPKAEAAGPTTTEFIVAGVIVAAVGAAVYTLL